MKEKIRNIFVVLLFAFFILYLLATGLLELTDKKNVTTVTVDAACTALKLHHSINLIPTGTDYYYIGIDTVKKEAYVIKASEKWLEKNFDDELMSYEEDGLEVRGLNKKVSDSKTRRMLRTQTDKLTGYSFPLGREACLYSSYVSNAALRIILAVLVLILTIVTIKIPKITMLQKKPVMILYCAALFAALFIMLTMNRL